MKESTKIAVVTAVITGAFTILAGLVTFWLTTSDPELSYTIAGSPTLSATSGSKRIVVAEVTNTGRREIANVFVQISLPYGDINESAFEVSPGIKVTESKMPKALELKADLLNPSDTIKVSILYTSASLGVLPRVTVRAPGVRGREVTIDRGRKDSAWLTLLPVMVAAFVTVLTSLSLARNQKIQEFLATVVGGGSASSLDQKELCAFVLGECGLIDEAEKLRFSSSEMTYRGTSDYLLHRAMFESPEIKERIVLSLKAIALHRGITQKSVRTLQNAIARVSGRDFSDDDLKAHRAASLLEGDDPVAWRESIRAYIGQERSRVAG